MSCSDPAVSAQIRAPKPNFWWVDRWGSLPSPARARRDGQGPGLPPEAVGRALNRNRGRSPQAPLPMLDSAVADDVRPILAQPLVEHAAEHAADDRRQPEQPQLRH